MPVVDEQLGAMDRGERANPPSAGDGREQTDSGERREPRVQYFFQENDVSMKLPSVVNFVDRLVS